MRRFFSYGPVTAGAHYYAPRKKLISDAYTALVGENSQESGHYITVWAPRQCGKTWVMLEIYKKLRQSPDFDVVKVDLEHLEDDTDVDVIAAAIAKDIFLDLGKKNPGIVTLKDFQELFTRDVLDKPLILILDEFDALCETAINKLTRIFRNIYLRRQKEMLAPPEERRYLLHGLALIGVRSVLGIENKKGSPFNIQQSLHIPNLSADEVQEMFHWYERESGQKVEEEIIRLVYKETRGQPGLTCWLGELLTLGFEEYTNDTNRPIGIQAFEQVYSAAIYALPNNNILNIISKVKEEDNQRFILELFKTGDKVEFTFDDTTINSLYMNGVVDRDVGKDNRYFLRFSSPLVQKRLFNYFSKTLFMQLGQLVESFSKSDNVVTGDGLNIPGLLKLYQTYLEKNSSWLFKEVPRRSDLRVYEAVFHFNLYAYIDRYLQGREGRVYPEFPTGNGKIDLLIRYKDNIYGIELKSYTDQAGYRDALNQAVQYGKKLQLREIFLVTFVDHIDETTRQTFEKDYLDQETGIKVKPVFITTGTP